MSQQILIVEDDHSILQMYKMKLEMDGFKVQIAENGETGLEKAESFKPALILLDLKMPLMGGEEMLGKLRSTDWGADIRVIVLTNISKHEAPSALRFLNVDRYIVKAHHTPAQLVEVVREVLNDNSAIKDRKDYREES